MLGNTFNSLVQNARTGIVEVPAGHGHELHQSGVLFVDVRSSIEQEEIIPKSLAAGRDFLENIILEKVPDMSTPLVLYCASGTRSIFATRTLKEIGYTQVSSLAGGFAAWKSNGFQTEIPVRLSIDEQKRYSRQIILPGIGDQGQSRLKKSRVVVIGAGGLGSPCLLYLAAAGIGHISIVDDDVVNTSNLQRQVLFGTSDVGANKAISAKKRLEDLNSTITVNAHPEKLNSSNARALLGGNDLIIDGTDNFDARYLISDTAVALNIPVVQGSVHQFNAEIALYGANGGACYRCIYPEAPPKEVAPSCSEAGVIGVVPGIAGLLQAAEAIKYVLGLGHPSGMFLSYHALENKFTTRNLKRRPGCVCSSTTKTTSEL